MDYSEFTKISVHNHFGGANSEKKINEQYDKKISFDLEDATEKIKDATKNNFNLLAFTNANVFSLIDYLKLKSISKEFNIQILPGVEINVSNEKNDKFLHVVLIIDPKSNLLNFQTKLNELICTNKNNYLTISQLVDLVINYKLIMIPHGIKQSNKTDEKKDRSVVGNIEQFKEIIDMDDAIPIILEDNKKYHFETLKMRISDELTSKEKYWLENEVNMSAADRQKFSDIESPTYIWGNNTFDDLYFSTIMKGSRIKRDEDIITKTSYISKIDIVPKVSNSQIELCTIYCSHGLNSIIGKSGSGKTLLLNVIKYNLIGEHLTCRTSGISEYKNIYKDVDFILYDANGKKINSTVEWNVFEGENLYNKILQVYASDKNKIVSELGLNINDLKFKQVMKNFSMELTDYCHKSIRIKKMKKQLDIMLGTFCSNIAFLKENKKGTANSISYFVDSKIETTYKIINNNINEILSDLDLYKTNYNSILEISKKYCMDDILKKIEEINQYIINSINEKMIKITIEKNNLDEKLLIQNELFKITGRYNSVLGKKIEVVMNKQQDNMRLIENIKDYIVEIISLTETLNLIPVSKKMFKNSLSLGDNNISKLIIKDINLNVDYSQLSTVFDSCIGSQRNKINLSEFKDINLNLCNYLDLIKFLDVFISFEYDFDIEISLDYKFFIEYELQLKNSNSIFENIETMSAGELSKTYINNLLDQQVNNGASNLIVLFDQPDSSLEKKFILNELVNKIDELRNHYQVFVTTHEPLLVVNADSNKIIEAQNNKSAVSIKNKITYKNISFINNVDSKDDMVDKIAELVDGSYDAIKTRNKIYGGMLNENKS